MKLADVRKIATPAEQVVPICVDGGLFAEHAKLERKLIAAQATGASDVVDLARQVTDVEQRMEAHTVEFRVTALPHGEWSDLLAAHPPTDKQRGRLFNPDTFALAAVVACLVDPDDVESPEDLASLHLDGRQVGALFDAVWNLNAGSTEAPKSLIASGVLRSYAPNSTTAPPEASPDPSS